MAIREIVWTVADNGKTIHPTAPQDGGVQGEHNATRAVWRVGESSVWETPTFKVYVECEDNAGNVDHTEPLQVVGGQISVLLPQMWTQYGGISTLRLVAEEEDGVVAYSVEGYARFSSRQNAGKKVDGLMKGRLAKMEAQMRGMVADATSAAEDAAAAAEAAVVAKGGAENAAQSASISREGAKHYATSAAENSATAVAAMEAAKQSAEKAAESASKAAENAAGGGGSGITVDDVKPFRFTVTKKGKWYQSSATYDEVKEVLTAGNRLVICEYKGFDIPFSGTLGEIFLIFSSSVLGVDTYISLDSEGVSVQTESAPVTVVNVLDYDAVGDGVSDDTDAIQSALDDAEKKGLPLYFPTGTYLVSSTITTHTRNSDADKQTSNLVIYGDGFGTVIKTTEDFDGDYVFHLDVSGVQPRSLWVHDFAIDLYADVSGVYFEEIGMKGVVENLWITFKYLKQETDTKVREGIFCNSATVTTFQQIKVMGHYLGLDGKRKTNCGIVVNGMHSCKIIDCDVTFCGWGIYLSGGSNNIIENCRIDENEYGIYQNSSTDIWLDTRAYAVGELPDSFNGTFYNLTISKNRFEGNNQIAILLISFSAGELNYMYNAQVTIANNDFTALGKGTALWHDNREVFRRAISLGRCRGIVIAENNFKGMPYESATVEITGADGKKVSYITTDQNIGLSTSVENLTLCDNVATAWPLWSDDTNYTVVKSSTKISTDLARLANFVNDIEANQTVGKVNTCVRGSCVMSINSGGAIDVSNSNVFELGNGVEVTGLNAYTGDLWYTHDVTFIALGETATIKNNDRIRLNGGKDFVMGEFDTVTLMRAYVYPRGYYWVEKSRSVNRAT